MKKFCSFISNSEIDTVDSKEVFVLVIVFENKEILNRLPHKNETKNIKRSPEPVIIDKNISCIWILLNALLNEFK